MFTNPCPNKDFWVFQHPLERNTLSKWCPLCGYWGYATAGTPGEDSFHNWCIDAPQNWVERAFKDWQRIDNPGRGGFTITRLY